MQITVKVLIQFKIHDEIFFFFLVFEGTTASSPDIHTLAVNSCQASYREITYFRWDGTAGLWRDTISFLLDAVNWKFFLNSK